MATEAKPSAAAELTLITKERPLAAEMKAWVEENLTRLPPDQRALLSLRYAARLPLDAIAQAMGLPIGTVKSRLHTAREGVRAFVERATGTESDDADTTCEPHSERTNDE